MMQCVRMDDKPKQYDTVTDVRNLIMQCTKTLKLGGNVAHKLNTIQNMHKLHINILDTTPVIKTNVKEW